MGRITETVKVLLIINILVFIGSQTLQDTAYRLFSLWYPSNPNFKIWQLITHMFMHGGFMHILFNMYALWAFGSPIEQMIGKKKFIFFYFSAGLGAAGLHLLYNFYHFTVGYEAVLNFGIPEDQIMAVIKEGKEFSIDYFKGKIPIEIIENFNNAFTGIAVGASGAIYGVLVAFGMVFPNVELMLIFLPVPIKAKYFIPGIILLDVFFGFTGYSILGANIAHFAHIGGAIVGFITMWYWKKNSFNQNRWN